MEYHKTLSQDVTPMMGHISDRTLDSLLDGSIDGAGELAIEEHVRRCDRCANRLREWELLFPQIRNVFAGGAQMPAGGPSPAMAGPAAVAAPPVHSVYIPDWTPPPSHRSVPARLAWGLVALLAVGAGYLLLQRFKGENSTIAYLPENYEAASQSATGDSAGLGSGISTPPTVSPATAEIARLQADSILARAREQAALEANVPVRENPPAETPSPVVATREPAEQEVRAPSPGRETPVTFPIRTDTARTEPAPASPLPSQFQRVTLGEAISRLSGTVRLIQGLNPEAVEIAQGSALPGAEADKAVVRVVYNAPEGRLILDQQRLGRPGAREPNIVISTAPNGVSVAQWVDRGGYWISLAGRADQQTLLAIANRIH